MLEEVRTALTARQSIASELRASDKLKEEGKYGESRKRLNSIIDSPYLREFEREFVLKSIAGIDKEAQVLFDKSIKLYVQGEYDQATKGFQGVVASGIDVNTWNQLKGGRSCVLGKAIPSHILATSKNDLQRYIDTNLEGVKEPGVFLTTDWEVIPDTPPENVHLVMNIITRD